MFPVSKNLSTRNGNFKEFQKLTASDADTIDYFGKRVSISSDGSIAVIGAPGEDTSPYSNNGAAYIFTRSGNIWTQQAKLTASDLASSDSFGDSVCISGDGSTIIIGAPLKTVSGYGSAGAAYIFTGSGSSWTQQAKLTASSPYTSDYFGTAVFLSSDGNVAFVGAPYFDYLSVSNSGAVYVFNRSGSSWTQDTTLLKASDYSISARFGESIALSKDNNTLIIGAVAAQQGGVSIGGAYVFVNGGSGSVFTQQQKLTAGDGVLSDQFGSSVALSGDGNRAVIGAMYETTSPKTNNGAAYVFNRSGNTWVQFQKLLASDYGDSFLFGQSVALSYDGKVIAISSPKQNTSPYTYNGAVYVFVLDSIGFTWNQVQLVTASDKATNYYFGGADGPGQNGIALSNDASTLIVGSYGADSSPLSANGAFYFFGR